MVGRHSIICVSFLLLHSAVHSAPCGNSPLQCLIGQAQCVGGNCVCNSASYEDGDGIFYCRKSGEKIAWLRNDPELRTFSEQRIPHPNLCRVLVAHVFQKLYDKNGNRVVGNSQVKIHAFQAKSKGKIFVYGFDVAALLGIQAFGMFIGRSARVYGTLQNGTSQITKEGATSFSSDGPFSDVDINYENSFTGAAIKLTRDAPNNREVFEVVGAGVTVSFVPYDEVLKKDQPNMPGLLVTVDSAFDTTYQTAGSPIARTPDVVYDTTGTGLSLEALALKFSLNGPVQQTQSNAPDACTVVQSYTAADCTADQYRDASLACIWLLEQPRFIRCVDKTNNGEYLQDLFVRCLKSFCFDANICPAIIANIKDAGCDAVPDIPELAHFMTGASCPA